MAARLNKRHSADVRSKIQCGVILQRLHEHFMGNIEMTDSQQRSAKILLDKSVSNAPTEIMADVDTTINIILRKPA